MKDVSFKVLRILCKEIVLAEQISCISISEKLFLEENVSVFPYLEKYIYVSINIGLKNVVLLWDKSLISL